MGVDVTAILVKGVFLKNVEDIFNQVFRIEDNDDADDIGFLKEVFASEDFYVDTDNYDTGNQGFFGSEIAMHDIDDIKPTIITEDIFKNIPDILKETKKIIDDNNLNYSTKIILNEEKFKELISDKVAIILSSYYW